MKKIPKIILTAACLLGSITFSCGASSGTKTRQSTGDPDIDAIWMQQGYTIVYGKPSGSTTKQTQPVQPQVKASVAPARAVVQKVAQTPQTRTTVQKTTLSQQPQSTSSSASTASSGTKTAPVTAKAQQQNEHTRRKPLDAFSDVHLVPGTVNAIGRLLDTGHCYVIVAGDILGKHILTKESIVEDKHDHGDPQSVIGVWQQSLRHGKGNLYCVLGNHDTYLDNFPNGTSPQSWIKSLARAGTHWVGTYPEPRVKNRYQPNASTAVLETVKSIARLDNTLIVSYLDSKYRDVGVSEKDHIKNGIQTMVQQLCANQFEQLGEIILALHCLHREGKSVIEGVVSELMKLDAQKKLIFDLTKARIIAIGGHEHISQNKQQQVKINYQGKTKTVGYYSAQSGHAYIEILPDGKVSFKQIQ